MLNGDELVIEMSRRGELRTADDRAVLMFIGDVLPNDDLSSTHSACGGCRALFELRHAAPIEDLTLPACPFCGADDWRASNVSKGMLGSDPPSVSDAGLMPRLAG